MDKDLYEIFAENTNVFYKQTDGGAEYLCKKAIEGTNVGDITTAFIRLDGEIELINKE